MQTCSLKWQGHIENKNLEVVQDKKYTSILIFGYNIYYYIDQCFSNLNRLKVLTEDKALLASGQDKRMYY